MRWAVTSNTALVPFRDAFIAGNIEEPGMDFTTETPRHGEESIEAPAPIPYLAPTQSFY
jgi:hypothetical protein